LYAVLLILQPNEKSLPYNIHAFIFRPDQPFEGALYFHESKKCFSLKKCSTSTKKLIFAPFEVMLDEIFNVQVF